VFPLTARRVFNVFCFFTIQSDLLVAATSILLLIRAERSSSSPAARGLQRWNPARSRAKVLVVRSSP
jgi:hypothetical protein